MSYNPQNPNGQATSANSAPVVLASDQSTVAVSAASLPLPTGSATAANQATGNTSLASIDTKTPALTSGRVPVDGSGVTQPVSAASLPLPSGASTSAAQTTGNTSLSSIDTKTPALVTGRVPVDGSGVTQPVSVSSLPLPSGAATETTLAAINTKIPTSPAQDRTTAGAPSSVRLSDGSDFYKSTTPSDTQPISAASLPLPAGAATSALQTQISGQLPASLGSKVSASSLSITLASDQVIPLPTGAATSALQTSMITALGSPFQAGGSIGNTAFALNAGSALVGSVKVSDGTNTATVKAASTASVASDTALVVAISPNNVVPVSRSSGVVSVAPTVTTTTYAANKCLGAVQTFSSVLRTAQNSGTLQSITLNFSAALTVGFWVVVFNASPGSSTLTDNTTASIAAGDTSKILTAVPLVNPISVQASGQTTYQVSGLNLPVTGTAGALYAVVVCQGAPAITSGTFTGFTLHVSQD